MAAARLATGVRPRTFHRRRDRTRWPRTGVAHDVYVVHMVSERIARAEIDNAMTLAALGLARFAGHF